MQRSLQLCNIKFCLFHDVAVFVPMTLCSSFCINGYTARKFNHLGDDDCTIILLFHHCLTADTNFVVRLVCWTTLQNIDHEFTRHTMNNDT